MMFMLVKKLRHEKSVMTSGGEVVGCGCWSGRAKRIGGGQASSGLEDSADEDARGCGEREWRLQMRK